MAYLTVLAGCLNYQNRIVLSSITESTYTQRAASFKRFEGVNFNPADGVETSQVLNLGEGFEPDYRVDHGCGALCPAALVCYGKQPESFRTV